MESKPKYWTLATFCLFSFYPLLTFIPLLFSVNEISILPFLLVLGIHSTVLFQIWLLWHCAYKKHGTKWLTLCLILGPIRYIVLIIGAFKNPQAWIIAIVLVDTFLFVWWYALSLKLRKVNKILRMQQKASPEYWDSIRALKEVKNLEELDWKFSALIKSWPQLEKISSKEYNVKKRELQTNPHSSPEEGAKNEV